MLDAAREGGMLKARGRQRTDSTHVLAAVRDLNRLELLAETLRAALNAIAAVASDWLCTLTPPEWQQRYGRRVEDMRLPETAPKREAYACQVGADGYRLLDALADPKVPSAVVVLPAVAVLHRVWARHLEQGQAGPGGDGTSTVRLRPVQGRGPGDRVESPYDTDARFRTKAGTRWTGYMVHLTETCDADAPHLVVHADTTPANVHEAPRTAPIHAALATKDLAPAEHLVDSAYVSADLFITARDQHGIDLVGPGRRELSWQSLTEGGFDLTKFTLDWDRQVARCPEGKESVAWSQHTGRPDQRDHVSVHFRAADCRGCVSRARCTRSASGYQGRVLTLLPRREHEVLAGIRARESTAEGRHLYAQRQGIEGTLSQAVRAFGLRRARYRGLSKTGLQHLATAAAINLDRMAAWFAGRALAPTRVSRFAALAV